MSSVTNCLNYWEETNCLNYWENYDKLAWWKPNLVLYYHGKRIYLQCHAFCQCEQSCISGAEITQFHLNKRIPTHVSQSPQSKEYGEHKRSTLFSLKTPEKQSQTCPSYHCFITATRIPDLINMAAVFTYSGAADVRSILLYLCLFGSV